MTKRGLTDIERFMLKVNIDPDTGCWNWTAAPHNQGYGSFGYGRKASGGMGMILAHRFSYMHFVGEIPEKYEVDHLCKNRLCVNPDHLEAVTTYVNNILRSDSPAAKAAKATSCPHGHPYNEENTRRNPTTGHRYCKTCAREMARQAVPRYKARKRALALGVEIPEWAKKLR